MHFFLSKLCRWLTFLVSQDDGSAPACMIPAIEIPVVSGFVHADRHFLPLQFPPILEECFCKSLPEGAVLARWPWNQIFYQQFSPAKCGQVNRPFCN
ncbi:hypothetical protein Q31b_47110 [Novipirellula aureliae]|uniref:Uncharacterized protein n=1 Tax=Novipirellula aureliae TaxID=2527966 RepID=A0A5C6DMP2_9BACT|nr:hypothetical protein Q31b_47110 [Novipirellula aureliae]